MKVQTILSLAVITLFAGCADSRVHITQASKTASKPPESGPVYRGKPQTFTPRIAVENAQLFDEMMLTDLRRNFIAPIEYSAYRYPIDSITFRADADSPGVWSLVVLLDTGAEVRLDDIVSRDEGGRTDFSKSYRRMISALNRARSGDDALDRYVHFWASR